MLFNICELSRKIRDREISPVELTHHCLVLIEKLNPALNAYITVTAESALDRARLAEREIYRGTYLGPLHGIPIGLKDIIDTAGVRTTAGSELFKDRIPTEDAEVVRVVDRIAGHHAYALALLQGRSACVDGVVSKNEVVRMPCCRTEHKFGIGLDRVMGAVGPVTIILVSTIIGALIVSIMTALLSITELAT